MSVEDETWDRPVCEFCKKVIPYEQNRFHRTGECVKELSLFKRIKPLNKQLALDLREYLNRFSTILTNIQHARSDINLSDLINSLKHHAK